MTSPVMPMIFLIATTTTSPTGAYNFTGLAVRASTSCVSRRRRAFPPPAVMWSSLDNGINNDNNGSQPGGPGTSIYSPVINLTIGAEPINDGDTNPDTELSVDFRPLHRHPARQPALHRQQQRRRLQQRHGERHRLRCDGVELLDGSVNNVIASTTTNSSAVSMASPSTPPAAYRVRIPTPPAFIRSFPAVADGADNGEDNDSNALQPGGISTAVISPVISHSPQVASPAAPASQCRKHHRLRLPHLPDHHHLARHASAVATQYVAYTPLTLTSSGGAGGYTYSISSGTCPNGMTLSSGGMHQRHAGSVRGTWELCLHRPQHRQPRLLRHAELYADISMNAIGGGESEHAAHLRRSMPPTHRICRPAVAPLPIPGRRDLRR
jgi:hypothetical protein